jgi:hypothetical protein
MANTYDMARRAMERHGISSTEIVAEMRILGICIGREAEMVDCLASGGPLAVGVAMALFGIIGRQNYMKKTIH